MFMLPQQRNWIRDCIKIF